MRKSIYIFIASLLVMALASCEKNAGNGYLGASVKKADIPFSVENVVTKALSPADDQIFSVAVYNGTDKVAEVSDYRELAVKPFNLVVDTYRLVASSGECQGAAFDSPVYRGETVVALRPEKLVKAEITATLSNVMASVRFDDELAGECCEYSVKLSAGDDNVLVYSNTAGTFDKIGYFPAVNALKWEIFLRKEVPGEEDINVKKEGIVNGINAGKHYIFDFRKTDSVSGDGFGAFQLVVDDGEIREDYDFALNFDAADADMVSVTPWARFALAEAKWFAIDRPEGLTFFYRKASESEWTAVDEATVKFNGAEKIFSAEITGLAHATAYVIKAAVSADDDATRSFEFTTESAPTIYNMNFDDWYSAGKYEVPSIDAASRIWDTANKGSSSVNVIPTESTTYVAVEGTNKHAAKLESKSAPLVGIAAGNIYTGELVKSNISVSNPGAQLKWGVPFTGRPLAMRGYCDYRPATVNQGSHAGMSGKPDIAQIQILLTDWASPFEIDTSTKTFVDFNNDPNIIAYGALDVNATSGYEEFVIPLVYRSHRIPKYAVVVASASKYGDYFTGGIGSILYVDEFSLEYDLTTLTDAQKEAIKYR